MATDLENEKINNSILDHIILGVAHEINNPNAFVRLNIMNLKKMFNLLRPVLDDYYKEHPDQKFGPYTMPELRSKMLQLLESTVGATVRIITVADKLKQCTSFALTQSDQVSLVDVISGVIEMHRFLGEKLASMDFHYNQDQDCVIEGHKLQLEQAFSILFTNACDAMNERYQGESEPKGKFHISVEDLGEECLVIFKDNGTGIPADIRAKIFTPYFTTKPQGVGDGMGLPLCQAVIDRHNGRIEVESEPGEGTSFKIYLPKQAKE